MRIRTALLALLVSMVLVGSASAVIDTIKIGHSAAFYVGDGHFRVPVYYANPDNEVSGVTVPFRYACSGGIITPDSVTRAGRTLNTNVWDLHMGMADGGETNPDSTCLAAVQMFEGLPAGQGIVMDLWFTGGYPGDLLSFIPLVNDTLPPHCPLLAAPDGIPAAPRSDLIIVENQLEFVCESSYEVQALDWLIIPFDIYGGAAPYEVELVHLTGPVMEYPDPSLVGDGPWEFRWRPGSNVSGEYSLRLQATDTTGLYSVKDISISVLPAPEDTCGVVRGDLTCDNSIDIADVVYLVDWMFTGGPPANCPVAKLDGSGKAVADTIRFLGEEAYFMGDGNAAVPLYYFNDQEIGGVQFPYRMNSTGGVLSVDSVTRAGRTAGTSIFNLLMTANTIDDPPLPDSGCVGLVTLSEMLPAGAGIVADVWFSGFSTGDIITLTPLDFVPPACEPFSSPADDGGGPVVFGTGFAAQEGGLLIVCGNGYSVNAFDDISFDITVEAGEPPYELEIASFSGSYPNPPELTGNDPWTFTWSPRNNNAGTNTLVLRATDDLGETSERRVYINVYGVTVSGCDYLRADTDCDGEVTIADLIVIIDYMFNNGWEPDCGR